jgi:hypothetical protein
VTIQTMFQTNLVTIQTMFKLIFYHLILGSSLIVRVNKRQLHKPQLLECRILTQKAILNGDF